MRAQYRRAPSKGLPPRCAFVAVASGYFEITATSVAPQLEQDLTAAIRFQGLFERFLELVERVYMLHCGGERSISHEVSQFLVNLLDLRARRVAYPIDDPESVETKTTVDELLWRHSRELPTLHAIDNNRAARFKRFGQLSDGCSTHRIEDEAEFLPAESLLNVLVQVVALQDYAVTSPLPHLSGSFFPPDDIQRLDSCSFASAMMYCPMAALAAV